MMPENQTEFKSWAKVEVMGHQSHIGFVTTEAYGAAMMFRIDQPELPEAEETLTYGQYGDAGFLPAGAVVRRPKTEAVSVLVGAGSIYRITPCTEEAAKAAIRAGARRPLIVVRLPDQSLIGTGSDGLEEEDESRGFTVGE